MAHSWTGDVWTTPALRNPEIMHGFGKYDILLG
jgi:hypothetical protein